MANLKLKPNHFYNICLSSEDFSVVCLTKADNGYLLREIDSDFSICGRTLVVPNNVVLSATEIFKEVKLADKSGEMFKAMFKIATCGDIDDHLTGSDTDIAHRYEWDHNVFSEFWDLPRSEESQFLNSIDRHGGDKFGVSSDVWFEDEEIVTKTLLKIKTIKGYLSEMKESTDG